MKHFLLFIATILSILSYGQTNSKHTYVKDYYRKDGTHVEGHYRTEKNTTNSDNFSTKGNTNPYTGQPGYIPSDNNTPTYSTPSYQNYNSTPTYTTTNSSYNNPNKYEGTTNSLGQKVITYSDGQEVFGLCKTCDNIIYIEKLDYYWYSSYSGVQKTKGNSGGTLLDGEYKFYNEKGNLIIKANYSKGLEHGDYISWTTDGKIKEKAHYINGKLNYIKFTNDQGYIIEWTGELFKKGSVKKVYTSSEKLDTKDEYFEDFKYHATEYYPSGKVKLNCTSNLVDFHYGPFTEYFENGKIKFQGFFNNEAFEIGKWKWYNEDGSVMDSLKFRYSEDKYSNGKIKEKGSFLFQDNMWKQNGRWYYYDESGGFIETREFEYGKEVIKDK